MQKSMQNDIAQAQGLMGFIRESPSMFHTAASIRRRLDAAGFTYLPEASPWAVVPGGSYYTMRNNSSVIAWRVGEELDSYHFQITAAHADSPTFKVKSVPEVDGPAGSLLLNVEPYGHMIDYTWFDKPLGLAGRVLVREGGCVRSRLIFVDRPVAIIPSVAIHMNRQVNAGFSTKYNVDLRPLVSAGMLSGASFAELIGRELGVSAERVLAHDLFLVNLQAPVLWGGLGAGAEAAASGAGAAGADATTGTRTAADVPAGSAVPAPEFVSAPKLDDLMCAYAALTAFIDAENPHDISVFCCFDNEEVGSGTKQGALSTFLRDTLFRLNAALGRSDEDLRRALAASMLVSCDNAHAVHPNHPELADDGARPVLNGGIVIKEAANQHYCTDAFSRAVFRAVLDQAGIPYQTFANRSDMAGGSTLGNLSNMQVSVHAVDVGCPQLAMHSSFETTGARDASLAVEALSAFYRADIRIDGADGAELS